MHAAGQAFPVSVHRHVTSAPHARVCGCRARDAQLIHAIAAALRLDDLDAALRFGLMESDPSASCAEGCLAGVDAARRTRATAFAARARFQARNARLARRREESEERRAAPRDVPLDSTLLDVSLPALPSAAADALARAKARAAQRRAR